MANRTALFCVCFFLNWAVDAQQLKLQGVTSGGQVSAANGAVKLSGSFGVPAAHSSTTLKGGVMGAASGLLIENQPPEIVFTEVTSFNYASPAPLSAIVTDPIDGVEKVVLRIRPIGGNTFDSVAMVKQSGTDEYKSTLSSSQFDAMGYEYYIAAYDNTTKRRRLPAAANYYAYAEITEPAVPNERLKPGNKKEDYRIITVPYVIGSNSIPALFNELGNADNSKWRLFSYDGNTTFKEYPQVANLQRGIGYWLLIAEDHYTNLKLSDKEKSPANNQSNLFELTLKPGWNLIGNPYTLPINWNDILTYNDDGDVGELKLFKGSYSNGTSLEPYEGGFVFLEGTVNKTIRISFTGQDNSGGRKSSVFDSDLSAEAWRLSLNLQQEDRSYELGGIGMHPEASLYKDRYDDHNPPHFTSILEVNFNHPEHAMGTFCRDIVPRQNAYHWTFSIDSDESSPITIRWDNQHLGESHQELYLYEPGSAHPVNMRVQNSYTVLKPGMLQIYYGQDVMRDILSEEPVIGTAFPNPYTLNSTGIVFPVALSGRADVQVDIFDSQGKVIKRIQAQELQSGFHEIHWQGDDEQKQPCAPGLYVYRVSLPGVKVFTGKLVIRN